MEQENVGGTTYFYNPEDAVAAAAAVGTSAPQEIPVGDDLSGAPHVFPNYSVYPGPPAHLKDFAVTTRGVSGLGPAPPPIVHPSPMSPSFFVPEELKAELVQRAAVCLSQINPSAFPSLPTVVEHFTELVPIESHHQKSSTFGYPSTVYKAVNSKNGSVYSLRRIHGEINEKKTEKNVNNFFWKFL